MGTGAGERTISSIRQKRSNVVVPSTARGKAARMRIMSAAETVLNRIPYGQARVSDVTNEAGTAFGLFYRYFPDFRSLAVEMIEAMLQKFDPVLALSPANNPTALLARIRAYHTITVNNHAEHPGLIRASPEVGMEDPEFRKRARISHMRYLDHVLGDCLLTDNTEAGIAQRRLRILALGGMSTSVLMEYYVWNAPSLRKFKLEREDVADWLSILFYRALTGHDPDLSGFNTIEKLAPLLCAE